MYIYIHNLSAPHFPNYQYIEANLSLTPLLNKGQDLCKSSYFREINKLLIKNSKLFLLFWLEKQITIIKKNIVL